VPGNQNIGIAWSDNAHGVVMLLNSARVTTGPTQNQNPTFVWNGTNWAQVLPLTTRLSPPAVGTGSPPNAHSSGLAGSAFLFSLFDESNTGSFAQYNPRDPWQFFYSPTLTTNAASGTFFSGTTLNGTTLGLDSVTWQFEWGTDRTYGNTTAGGTASSGTQSVSENLTGLTPSTTYFYRLTGSSSGSPVFFGDPVSFTTDALVDHPTLYCQFSLH
jgi:hypothetical protein